MNKTTQHAKEFSKNELLTLQHILFNGFFVNDEEGDLKRIKMTPHNYKHIFEALSKIKQHKSIDEITKKYLVSILSITENIKQLKQTTDIDGVMKKMEAEQELQELFEDPVFSIIQLSRDGIENVYIDEHDVILYHLAKRESAPENIVIHFKQPELMNQDEEYIRHITKIYNKTGELDNKYRLMRKAIFTRGNKDLETPEYNKYLDKKLAYMYYDSFLKKIKKSLYSTFGVELLDNEIDRLRTEIYKKNNSFSAKEYLSTIPENFVEFFRIILTLLAKKGTLFTEISKMEDKKQEWKFAFGQGLKKMDTSAYSKEEFIKTLGSLKTSQILLTEALNG